MIVGRILERDAARGIYILFRHAFPRLLKTEPEKAQRY